MMIKAKLSNPNRPDAQPVAVSFPIEDYDGVYRRLAAAGIGDAVARDCQITEITGSVDALEALQGQKVNVDELDYLAKRLDSFFEPEALRFEGTASAKGVRDIESLINLTFCCEQVTLISDFSDLARIGKDHYMAKHGGCAPVDKLEALDAEGEARELIQNSTGAVTPYGVVYDNGMELEPLYKGRAFPGYLYENSLFEVVLKNPAGQDSDSTFLFLPMPEVCVERALKRGGFSEPGSMTLAVDTISLSSDILRWIDPAEETPAGLNEAAKAIATLDEKNISKLCAAAEYIEPGSAAALRALAERIDLFEFCPGVSTAEEYGRYMITESGHFEYDANLVEFYDFKKYGEQRLADERGAFLEGGYISYNGDCPLEDLFPQRERTPEQGMTMGGM